LGITEKERDLADTNTDSDTEIELTDLQHENAVYDVSVDVIAVLGVAEMKIEQVLRLGRGAVVELEHRVDEPVDLMVNGQLIAKGEVVVVEDRLAIQVTKIITNK